MSDLRPDPVAEELAIESPPGELGESSLSAVALRGVALNWVGAVVLVIGQIVSTVITARLVDPAGFGAYATAQAAAGFLGYFTLMGLGPGVQRRERLGPKTLPTALVLSGAAAALVSAVLFAAAEPWSRAWGIADAESAVRALAIAMLFTSLAVVPLAILGRNLRFRAVMLLETGSIVFGLAAGVVLAIAMRSPLALALGQAAGGLAVLVGAAWLARRELRIGFDRLEARELFTFAGQVGGLGFVTYFTIAIPSFFISRNFGAAPLGFYSRANLIAALPAEYVFRGVLKVLMPLYGRLRGDRERIRTLLDEALTLATGLVWPVFGLLAGAAPVVLVVGLGARWEDAAPLLSLSALIVSAWVPCGLLTSAAEALGWMRAVAYRQGGFLVGTLATLVAAAVFDLGVTQLLVGIAIVEWTLYLVTLRVFVKRRLVPPDALVKRQGIHLLLGLAAFGIAAAVANLLETAPTWVAAVAEFALGLAVVAAILLGRRWIPATEVLARRLGVGPDRGIIRAGWSVIGSGG